MINWKYVAKRFARRAYNWRCNFRSVGADSANNIRMLQECRQERSRLMESNDAFDKALGHRTMLCEERARERDRLKGELAEARRLIEEIPGTFTPGGWIKRRDAFLAAPPADATTESRSVQRRKAAQKSEPAPTFAAAPPVTGDGVETKRTMPWPKPACSVSLPCGGCFTRGICDQLMWESGKAAGLAHGRELGARDEKDHARAMEFLQEMSQPTTYAGGCAWCGGFDEHGDICELRDWLAEIEARRAGREGK